MCVPWQRWRGEHLLMLYPDNHFSRDYWITWCLYISVSELSHVSWNVKILFKFKTDASNEISSSSFTTYLLLLRSPSWFWPRLVSQRNLKAAFSLWKRIKCFSVHTTRRNLKTVFSLWKRSKCLSFRTTPKKFEEGTITVAWNFSISHPQHYPRARAG